MTDLQKQFEAEFAAAHPQILAHGFFRRHATKDGSLGDYYYPEAHFAWLGYQTGKAAKQ